MMPKLWKEILGEAILRATEEHWRLKIALEIEELCCNPLNCKDKRASITECGHNNAKWEKAASIARGKYA